MAASQYLSAASARRHSDFWGYALGYGWSTWHFSVDRQGRVSQTLLDPRTVHFRRTQTELLRDLVEDGCPNAIAAATEAPDAEAALA